MPDIPVLAMDGVVDAGGGEGTDAEVQVAAARAGVVGIPHATELHPKT